MGNRHSRSSSASQEDDTPIVIHNTQNVPIRFSPSLLASLSSSPFPQEPVSQPKDTTPTLPPGTTPLTDAQIHSLKTSRKEAGEDVDVLRSLMVLGELLDRVGGRQQEYSTPTFVSNDERDQIAKIQDEVVECYLKNRNTPLDCWRQVEAFKQVARSAQTRFVQA